MTNLVIVAIRDAAVDAFNRPFFLASTGQALRAFGDEVNRAADDNEMYKHPEHFELFELGSFDDKTGLVESLKVPRSLGTAEQFKR